MAVGSYFVASYRLNKKPTDQTRAAAFSKAADSYARVLVAKNNFDRAKIVWDTASDRISKAHIPWSAAEFKVRIAQQLEQHGDDMIPDSRVQIGKLYAEAIQLDPANVDASRWANIGSAYLMDAARTHAKARNWQGASMRASTASKMLMAYNPHQALLAVLSAQTWLAKEMETFRSQENIIETLTIRQAKLVEREAKIYNALLEQDARARAQTAKKLGLPLEQVPEATDAPVWRQTRAHAWAAVAKSYQVTLEKDPQHPNAPQWQQDLTEAVCRAGPLQFELGESAGARDLVGSGIMALIAYHHHLNGQFTPEQKRAIEKSIDVNHQRMIQVLRAAQPIPNA